MQVTQDQNQDQHQEFLENYIQEVTQDKGSIWYKTDVPTHDPDRERLEKLKAHAAELAAMSDNKKKLTFSKKLLIAGLVISLLMCIACIVLRVVFKQEISDIMTITLATFFTDSTYGSFYYWKEKNANRAKYAQQFVLLFADAYGVDAAIRIAEVVLRD